MNELTSAKEPGLDNVAELGRGNVTAKHLLAVVPSHAAIGSSASNENDFGLTGTSNCFDHCDSKGV